MRKMIKNQPFFSRIPVLLAALAISLTFVSLPVSAEEGEEMKPVFTRVAVWDVKRAHWGEFMEFMKVNRPVMEQLFNEGVISDYGIDATALHHPEGYTHSTWFTTGSMADMDKVYAAWKEADEKLSEAERMEREEKFDSMLVKHADYMIRTEFQRARKATVENGYFQSARFRVKMGKGKAYMSYFNHRIKPVYEGLLASGDIVAYGRSEEEIVTGKPGTQFVWYVVEDGAGLDKVRAAFDANWEEMDEEGRRARWTSIMDFVEEGSFRENLTHIGHMQVAAH